MNDEQNWEMRSQVLIVDDMPENIKFLRSLLKPENYEILAATNGERALKIATEVIPDLILLDIMLPGIDGYSVCQKLKQNEITRHIPVIFITAEKKESSNIITGFDVGGVDFITKPFYYKEVLARVSAHLKNAQLTKVLLQKNIELQQEISKRQQAEAALQTIDEQLSYISKQEAERWGIKGFITQSQTMAKILALIRRLHNSDKISVLITGESGTGKELIARAIHFGGKRSANPFVPVNCSAIPAELAESTFFGHVRGAFTSANTARKGCFEIADGGTLFLDEIGDMPLELQAKLLRVLEDGAIIPVGGVDEKNVDVRILAATNAGLQTKIADGKFREDLYHRLAGFTIEVPSLRERKEDIPLLAKHFLELFAKEMGREKAELSPKALVELGAYHFPGNIRELKNIIEHAMIVSNTPTIQPEHLRILNGLGVPDSPPTALPKNNQELKAALTKVRRKAAQHLEREVFSLWLLNTGGNVAAAARQYGISRAFLSTKINEHGLDLSQLRRRCL